LRSRCSPQHGTPHSCLAFTISLCSVSGSKWTEGSLPFPATARLSARLEAKKAALGKSSLAVKQINKLLYQPATSGHFHNPTGHGILLCIGRRPLGYSQPLTLNFFPLYHFFPLFFSLFFHLPQRFPLNTPPIPHYHCKISFSIPTINFLSTNNYSWTHSTVFRVMNSDTLDLGGERREPTRRGHCRGHRCGRHARGGGGSVERCR
jgi:hypothetical protein